MSTTATPTSGSLSPATLASAKDRFLEALDRESKTTAKVMRAYPPDQGDLRPHEKLKTAKELAFLMAIELGMAERAMRGENALAGPRPEMPSDFAGIVATLEQVTAQLRKTVESMPEAAFAEMVPFPIAPKTMGQYSKIDFLWFLLLDQIHHRGQFSIYLRIAGGKLPSIYGPTADEPW